MNSHRHPTCGRLGIRAAPLVAVVALCLTTAGAAHPQAVAGPDSIASSVVDTLAIRPPGFAIDSTRVDPGALRRVPLDLRIANRVRSRDLQESLYWRHAAGALRFAALPGTLLLAGALYGAGEVGDRPALTETGTQIAQAVVAAGAVSLAAKVVVGRARPRTSPDDPGDLRFARGLRADAFQSFPSAHTAAAFAAAAVLHGRGSAAPWLIPIFYGSASLAGLSRMYHDEHWATDVLGGAIVGVGSGLLTVRFHDGS